MKTARKTFEIKPVVCENCGSTLNLNTVDDMYNTIFCDNCLDLSLEELGYDGD